MAKAPERRAPARTGDPVAAIDTPALVLDLDALEANLAAMAERCRAAGVALRPHAKAHKCVEIARRQIALGAIGICCQKVSEAEVFARAGIADILVSNEVIGARKLDRLAVLAKTARMAVCVDHPAQVAALALALRKREARMDVLIELDVGQRRCGVAGADEAVALALNVREHGDVLTLRGLQAYFGSAQHYRDPQKRRAAINDAAVRAVQTRRALQARGFDCAQVTGGGTGTYMNELDSGVYTEIQPGSYVLMDADYAANEPDAREQPFAPVLRLQATVITSHGDRAVLDAGLKSTSAESGLPRCTEPGWTAVSISDEHVVIERSAAPVTAQGSAQSGGALNGHAGPTQQIRDLQPGDFVRLIPGHCDPTVNLHDWLVVVDGSHVKSVWPVDARGMVY